MKRMIISTISLLFLAGRVSAQSNQATIEQNSVNNFAIVRQAGAEIQARVFQTGNGNVVGTTVATDAEGVLQNGTSNQANIIQTGSGNFVSQYRPEKNVFAGLLQTGTGNEAAITQIGNAHKVGLNVFAYHAGIEQAGEANLAAVTQQDGNENQVRELFQAGTANQAMIMQNGSENYVARLHQTGNLNISSVYQYGTGNAIEVALNGSWNHSVAEQGTHAAGSSDNEATQWINGTSNTVTLVQTGLGSNDAFQWLPSTYSGGGNDVSMIQDGQNNDGTQQIGGDGNVVSTTQIGGYNTAITETYGDLNGTTDIDGNSGADPVTILQTGDYHSATILQTGNQNGVSITQNGNHHAAEVTQTGNSNRCSITQSN